jgi:hypothetical protein
MHSSQIAISKIVACSIYARVMDEFILTSVLIKLSTTMGRYHDIKVTAIEMLVIYGMVKHHYFKAC